jgi:acetyl-CoA carboxylase biotin carboxyl carrier protein
VKSPLTGIFYHAPSEGEAPYVRTGQEIKPDDVVGLVESMKVFVEVRAEMRGVVGKILVANDVQVTKDQPLVELQVP